MKAHPANADIQCNACSALINITAENASTSRLVFQAGGSEAVLGAMNRHGTDTDVLHTGCWVILRMAVTPDFRRLVIKASGIESVIAAMKAHPTCLIVQHYGCGALLQLSWSSVEVQKRIEKLGGADVARKALCRFPSHNGVQGYGNGLLKKIW